jgi:hypothetical protein
MYKTDVPSRAPHQPSADAVSGGRVLSGPAFEEVRITLQRQIAFRPQESE